MTGEEQLALVNSTTNIEQLRELAKLAIQVNQKAEELIQEYRTLTVSSDRLIEIQDSTIQAQNQTIEAYKKAFGSIKELIEK